MLQSHEVFDVGECDAHKRGNQSKELRLLRHPKKRGIYYTDFPILAMASDNRRSVVIGGGGGSSNTGLGNYIRRYIVDSLGSLKESNCFIDTGKRMCVHLSYYSDGGLFLAIFDNELWVIHTKEAERDCKCSLYVVNKVSFKDTHDTVSIGIIISTNCLVFCASSGCVHVLRSSTPLHVSGANFVSSVINACDLGGHVIGIRYINGSPDFGNSKRRIYNSVDSLEELCNESVAATSDLPPFVFYFSARSMRFFHPDFHYCSRVLHQDEIECSNITNQSEDEERKDGSIVDVFVYHEYPRKILLLLLRGKSILRVVLVEIAFSILESADCPEATDFLQVVTSPLSSFPLLGSTGTRYSARSLSGSYLQLYSTNGDMYLYGLRQKCTDATEVMPIGNSRGVPSLEFIVEEYLKDKRVHDIPAIACSFLLGNRFLLSVSPDYSICIRGVSSKSWRVQPLYVLFLVFCISVVLALILRQEYG